MTLHRQTWVKIQHRSTILHWSTLHIDLMLGFPAVAPVVLLVLKIPESSVRNLHTLPHRKQTFSWVMGARTPHFRMWGLVSLMSTWWKRCYGSVSSSAVRSRLVGWTSQPRPFWRLDEILEPARVSRQRHLCQCSCTTSSSTSTRDMPRSCHHGHSSLLWAIMVDEERTRGDRYMR